MSNNNKDIDYESGIKPNNRLITEEVDYQNDFVSDFYWPVSGRSAVTDCELLLNIDWNHEIVKNNENDRLTSRCDDFFTTKLSDW